MSAAAQYAYLHARVSALASGLSQEGDFHTLLEDTLDEPTILARIGLNVAPGITLEQTLFNRLLADVQILVRPTSGGARDLLIHWVRRHELSNLKAMIRGRLIGRTSAEIREELIDLGPFSVLPVAELLQSEDVLEMLRRLETTPYGEVARQARAAFEARNEWLAVDAAIDRHYYAGLSSRARALSASDQQYLRPLLGAILDRINLLWLLRYRFVYQLAPAHTYYLLVPAGGHLTGDPLRALVGMGSMEEVIRALPAPLYSIVEGAVTLTEVEDRMVCELVRRAETVLNRAVFSVARAFAYLVLRTYQLQRIHILLRGKQLRLSKTLITDTVSCPRSVHHV